MLGFLKTLNEINETLKSLHVDLVEIKEEIRHNNEQLFITTKEIKKGNENIKKQLEDELIQASKQALMRKEDLFHIIDAIEELKEAVQKQRKELEALEAEFKLNAPSILDLCDSYMSTRNKQINIPEEPESFQQNE